MCGIFVAFNPGGTTSIESVKLTNAIESVKHRGPDNIGEFRDSFCFLGHARLSIIDLNASSDQPFKFKNLQMTYNGEVFNFEELRADLELLGRSFSTNSDTEVVLQAYDEWGVDCFERFNGMWALAIYDTNSHELLVSRDRFGQKPLFLAKYGDDVFFASEFQQLVPFVEKVVDFGLIQLFLKEGAYENQGCTFMRTIQEFPKAHYLKISSSGVWESRAYWRYWSGEITETTSESIEVFSELLSDATNLRLKSDVPFGVLVSGGVDSTLVAHYARCHSGKASEIHAFSYSSEDQFDERCYAERVANMLNLNLHVSTQDASASAYTDRLKHIVKHLGRGHSSPAIVSIDYLYEAVAKCGIRVAIDGQGADELLAGYKTYFMLVIPWYLARGRFKQAFLALRDQKNFGFIASIILYFRSVFPPSLRKIMRMLYGYEKLFKSFRQVPVERLVKVNQRNSENSNLLNRYLIKQHNAGLENLIYYGDIVSMMNGVENRSPFMDHRLVEYSFKHDDELKLFDAVDKYALRRSQPYFEYEDILERSKLGFPSAILPETKIYMANELKNSPILCWPIFNKRIIKFASSEDILSEKYERLLFRLYQVHLWNEIFVGDNEILPEKNVA
jgi:asparagine synthase (glutamine-hydrolysing)